MNDKKKDIVDNSNINQNNVSQKKMNLNKFNKVLIMLLMFITTALYVAFMYLTTNTYQISNFLDNSFLKKLDIGKVGDILQTFSSIQDGVIIFGVLPELVIIILLLFIILKFEKNNKNTINSNIVHIIISGIFFYFTYINIFGSGIVTNLLSKIYYYNLINIALTILLVFLTYYIIYKIANIVVLIKNKQYKDFLKTYTIYYYPFLIIALIFLILNIFSSLTISYMVSKILDMISLSSFIVFTNIVNIPLDVNISQMLPDFIANILNFLNINLNFTLQSIGITDNLINTIFNNLVLNNLDDRIDILILNWINGILFVNIYNVVACGIIIIISGIIEYIDRDKYYYNAILSVLALLMIININTLFFNILKIGFIVSFVLFMYIILVRKKDRTKEIIDYFKNKYNKLIVRK